MNNILLSICIPTYNRADVLDETLNKLFSNPEFDKNLIEVIVSDNCSTDNTKHVVSKYPFVKYFCNDKNVRDYNYSIVLGLAKGSYIRLFNDTLSFKQGALERMLNTIKKHSIENCNLFFYNNMFLNKDSVVSVNNKNDFIENVSFHTTWIANFGCWRQDFNPISNKDKYAEFLFVQVDWSYRILKNTKRTIIYFDDFFEVAFPKNKGGYNVFDIFINKYLFIIKKENFKTINYETEKFRLCRYFVYPWLISLFVTDKKKYSFETEDVFKILFKKYWYEPYFYPMLILFWINKIKNETNN